MSGHSKWHNIQAKKGKADAAKGRIFTKLGREIAVAAKSNPNPYIIPVFLYFIIFSTGIPCRFLYRRENSLQ